MRRAACFLGLTVMALLGLTGAAYAGLAQVPEPASMTLLGAAAGVIAIVKFRKRK